MDLLDENFLKLAGKWNEFYLKQHCLKSLFANASLKNIGTAYNYCKFSKSDDKWEINKLQDKSSLFEIDNCYYENYE